LLEYAARTSELRKNFIQRAQILFNSETEKQHGGDQECLTEPPALQRGFTRKNNKFLSEKVVCGFESN
jgi:hypothetical protein